MSVESKTRQGTTNASGAGSTVRLGIDAYSLRSQQWDAFQLLDYASRLGVNILHFSEIRLLGSIEDAHLRAVKDRARELGIDLEIGMRSICPTSHLFDASQGSAEGQLSRMIGAAKTIGSPIVRAVVGDAADRGGPVPMERHIENTVGVLHAVRSLAMDSGIKIAIENHSGDLQAWQLKNLIEQAGPNFVGACLDSGNPLITLEDPHTALETLAPLVLTSHVRDSTVWITPEGAAAAWVPMGKGNVGIDKFLLKFVTLCPDRALSLEIIVSPRPRPFPYRKSAFWDAYLDVPAWQFARFLELAKGGGPPDFDALTSGEDIASRERAHLESSLQYTRQVLSSGCRC